MFKILSKILTKIILLDGDYFRKKMLLTSVVYGDRSRVHIGSNVNLQDVILNTSSGHIYIGDYCFFGHNCMVLTGAHDASMKDEARIEDHPVSGRDINLGKGVWVSSGAIILGGISIADYSVIAAGAVVTKDCLISGIYGGVPAKILAKLN